jgi:hypothetical protein
MDIGTTNDFIKDLQEENARLHQAIANLCNEMVVLESEAEHYKKASIHLFSCAVELCGECSAFWLSAIADTK